MTQSYIQVGTPIITDRNGCTESLNRYFDEFASFVAITADEERLLIERIQQGDKQAEKELFAAHGRFVIFAAKKAHSRMCNESRAASLNDFIQWGNEAILKAMRTHDLTYQNRFLSFAVKGMKWGMEGHFHSEAKPIRLPLNQVVFVARYRKEHEKSLDELFVSHDGMQVLNCDDDYYYLTDTERAALAVPRRYHALDDVVSSRIGADDSLSSIDCKAEFFLRDENLADKKLMDESRNTILMEAIENGLRDPRDRQIVLMHFGIEPYYSNLINSFSDLEMRKYYQQNFAYGMDLDEIGVLFNLTKERTRQVLNKALQRLRHNSCSIELKQCYDE